MPPRSDRPGSHGRSRSYPRRRVGLRHPSRPAGDVLLPGVRTHGFQSEQRPPRRLGPKRVRDHTRLHQPRPLGRPFQPPVPLPLWRSQRRVLGYRAGVFARSERASALNQAPSTASDNTRCSPGHGCITSARSAVHPAGQAVRYRARYRPGGVPAGYTALWICAETRSHSRRPVSTDRPFSA